MKRPRAGDRVEVTVEGLRPDGLGAARLSWAADGSGAWDGAGPGPTRATELRVEDGLPGERGTVLLTHVGQNAAFGRMVSRDAATVAEDRRADLPCPRWTAASPCRLMHLSPEAQARFKRARVCDALAAHGLDGVPVEKTLVASPPLGWRARATYVAARDREDRLVLGAYRRGTHRVQDMAGCPLEEPAVGEVAAALQAAFEAFGVPVADLKLPVVPDPDCGAPRDPDALLAEASRPIRPRTPRLQRDGLRYVVLRANAAGQVVAALLTPSGTLPGVAALAADARRRVPVLVGVFVGESGAGDAIFGPGPLSPVGDAARLEESFGGLSLSISPSSFFQVNRDAADRLHDLAAAAALEAASAAPATIVDVYCGVGALALRIAAGGARVKGVEIVPEAVADARRNASTCGLDGNVDFVASDAADALLAMAKAGDTPDALVLNPPRKGCAPAVLDAAMRLSPRRIVYVSCNPETLARDLARLDGAYVPCAVRPVDLFPQSEHVEVLAILDLR